MEKRTLSIKQAAAFCGVSERTLRYYDRMGLVCPRRTAANYRVYTDTELLRLIEVLFYRELDIPIGTIRQLLDAKDHDRRETLRRHWDLLLLRREQIDRMLALLQNTLEDTDMKRKKPNEESYAALKARYREETLERWGRTEEYRISQEKEAARDERENDAVMTAAGEIFAAFAALAAKTADPAAEEAQALVSRWQAHISAHHYPCTKQILASLGQMYVGDERFQANLDAYGEGTAQFMSDAIQAYCAE